MNLSFCKFESSLYRLPIILLTLALIITACTHDKNQRNIDIQKKLELIETLSDNFPDSAYGMLREISWQHVEAPSERALYILLMVKAKNSGYSTEFPDSIIDEAIKYYDDAKDIRRLTESYIQKGYSLLYKEQYPVAMISVWEGLDCLKNYKQPLVEGRLHQLAGEICLAMNDVVTELEHRRVSYRKYIEAGDTSHHDYAIVLLSTSLINNRQYAECIEFLKANQFWSSNPNPLFVREIMENRGLCIYELGNYRDALYYLCKADTLFGYSCSAYGLNRIVKSYISLGNTDSASMWLDILKKRFPQDLSLYDGLQRYAIAKHDYKVAVEMSDSANQIQYAAIENMLTQKYSNTLSKYYKDKVSLTEQLRQRDNFMHLIIFIFIIIGIILILLFFYQRNQKNKEMREYLIADILQKNEQLTNNQNIHESLRNKIEQQKISLTHAQYKIEQHESSLHKLEELNEALFKDKHSLLNSLSVEYYESNDSESSKKRLYNRIKAEIDRLAQPRTLEIIEEEVNSLFDNVIADMRNDFKSFKEVDFRFITLYKAGFSPRIICMVCNITISNFYVKKKRLRDRLSNYEGIHKDKYLCALNIS